MKWLIFIKPVSKIVFQFKASSNGFNIKRYFQKCGDLTNTIIIAKTKKGKIIGGFTPLILNPSANWSSPYEYQYIKDESNSSFIFSLSEKQKFQLKKDKEAIVRWKDKNYIVFRGAFQIWDNSNTNDNNSFYLS